MDDSWREVVAEWQGGGAFVGRNPDGETVQMGCIEDESGVSPMEMLLMGVAGCTGMDVASILRKMRQPLDDLRVVVRGKRAPEPPRVYTEIHVDYLLWGDGLDPQAVEKAIQLSEEKYCSASHMMKAVARMHYSYRILNPGEQVSAFQGSSVA